MVRARSSRRIESASTSSGAAVSRGSASSSRALTASAMQRRAIPISQPTGSPFDER